MATRKALTSDEIKAAPGKASAWYAERFGFERRALGRRQALDVVRIGWGCAALATAKELGAAFDAAVTSGEVLPAGKVTFSVAYSMAPGASAGGSSMGARPVSADVFDASSVRAWAERMFHRLASHE